MARVYNFSAGPAVLPEEVLAEAASEMLDYRGSGMSVMEMSHRSKPFGEIIENAEADLRELVGIPENYRVLFLQGGASQQFAAVPMNLMRNRVADYIITGAWAKKAFKEAKIYGDARAIASSEDETFSYIPDCSDLDVSPDADYVYICENNTIYGTKFHTLPNTKGKDLVADVSSCFLSEPVDITKYGVMYGGAQKNIGPAGVVISIIREDLITDDVLEGTPTMLKWKTQADANSLYNTPPAYGIYICGKVFKWLKDQGGLEAMQKRNQEKAAIALRLPRCEQALPRHRAEGRPLAYERPVRHRRRRPRRRVRGRGQGRRPGEPEGPPQRRRHARQHLQRHAPRRRRGPRGLHGRVRTRSCVGAFLFEEESRAAHRKTVRRFF